MDQKRHQQQDLVLLADFMLSFFLLSKAAPPGTSLLFPSKRWD